MNYPTAHINAKPEDFSKTVLMPGDPLRSEFVAKNFFENAVLINNVRGIAGYSGNYKGKKISVMASGMGMPSMGIYSYELLNFFNVENIIRIGTAGAFCADSMLREIILALGASTDSSYASQFNLSGTFAPTASFDLLQKAYITALEKSFPCSVGNILTSDVFYNADATYSKRWSEMNIKCVDMETAALYINAARAKKNALSILTISDNLATGEKTSSQERQTAFLEMIELALETALKTL